MSPYANNKTKAVHNEYSNLASVDKRRWKDGSNNSSRSANKKQKHMHSYSLSNKLYGNGKKNWRVLLNLKSSQYTNDIASTLAALSKWNALRIE